MAELEGIWVAAGDSHTGSQLREGLTPDEIQRATEGLPLRLPDEAMAWFGWHDGGESPTGSGPPIGGSRIEFLTLEWACNTYRFYSDFAQKTATLYACTPAEAGWHPAWFPVVASSNGTIVSIDCSVQPGEPAPIRVVGKGDNDAEKVDFESLAELLQGWIDLYRNGVYQYRDGEWVIEGLSDHRLVDGGPIPRRMKDVL
jgi:cell wall assembly regulator SMI1